MRIECVDYDALIAMDVAWTRCNGRGARPMAPTANCFWRRFGWMVAMDNEIGYCILPGSFNSFLQTGK